MNIAWVEDDPSSMETGAKVLIELLEKESGNIGLMEMFEDPNQEVTPERLEKFFVENTLCKLSWFKTYSSMKDAINQHCDQDWDVVIIDLNLENDFQDKGKIDPEQAGFAIYVQLLRFGFSFELISFYTGNKKEVDKLFENAEKLGIPTPKSSDKGNKGELKKWLKGHIENKNIILRRGILDGCKNLSSMLRKSENELRINLCAFDEDGKIEKDELANWLEIWPRLMPKLPSLGYRNQYFPFILTLLSLWDKKAKKIYPTNTAMARSSMSKLDMSDKDRGFAVIPFLLTHARNWSAHGQALHDAIPQDVAFIFLLAGRGLVKRQSKPFRHEKMLLSLFPQWNEEVNATDISRKVTKVIETVKSLPKKDNIDGKIWFNQLANLYVTNSSVYSAHNPSRLLMWSLLIDLATNSKTPVIDSAMASRNANTWKPEYWKGDNDWLEQFCFSLFAYLKETDQ